MALCNITGTLYYPSGDPARTRQVWFHRAPESVAADYLGTVLPDDTRTRSAYDGSVDFNLITGYYIGEYEGTHGRITFKLTVPEAASARLEDCIAAVDPVEPMPMWLVQIIAEREAAEAAAVVAEEARDETEAARDETLLAAPFAVKNAADFFSRTSLVAGARYWSKDGLAWDVLTSGTGDFVVAGAQVRVVPSDGRVFNLSLWGVSQSISESDMKSLLEMVIPGLPSGSTLEIPPGTYSCGLVAATAGGDLTINAGNVTLVNSTQTNTGVPIFKVTGSGSESWSLIGLNVVGPRPDESTSVPNDNADGMQFDNFAKVSVVDGGAKNAYSVGVRAVRCGNFLAHRNTVVQCGYGGIQWHSVGSAEVSDNNISDIGAVIVTYGYGVSAATTFPARNGGPNGYSHIYGNTIMRCKRRSIDVHCGLKTQIHDNNLNGFGHYAIRVTGEDVYKEVEFGHIHDNVINIDSDLGVPTGVFEYGSFGDAARVTDINSHSNSIIGNGSLVSYLYTIHGTTSTSPSRGGDRICIMGDVFDSTSPYGFVNMATGTIREFSMSSILNIGMVRNRVINFGASCDNVSFVNNDFGQFLGVSGQIGFGADWSKIDFYGNRINNTLLGSQRKTRIGGLYCDKEASQAGVTANIDLCSAEITGSDASLTVEVEVVVSRVSGISKYKGLAWLTRAGSTGTPTASATAAMAVDIAGTGTLTAPQLEWYDVSTSRPKLRLIPGSSFSSYQIRLNGSSFRGQIYGAGIA